MTEKIKTLIIGGGISGLATARRLKDERHDDFLVVTDRPGGRMYHCDDPPMNLGATYVNDDYRNVLKFVGKGQKLRIWEVFALRDGRLVRFLGLKNLAHATKALRILGTLRKLRLELRSFRKKAEHTAQDELLPCYPLMNQLAEISASDYVRSQKLEYLNQNFFRYCFWATTFAPLHEANALFYLGVLFPLITNTYVADFSTTYERLTDGYQDALVIDRIGKLERLGKSNFLATTDGGRSINANQVVIAAPYHNASQFYDVPKPHLAKPATVVYAKGVRKGTYRGKKFILTDPGESAVGLIWTQQNSGMDLIFAIGNKPDLSEYYEEVQVVRQVSWKTAVVLSNGDWVPMAPEPNLYLAGDYNICGLEDSFISGVCAANLILMKNA